MMKSVTFQREPISNFVKLKFVIFEESILSSYMHGLISLKSQ